MKKLEMKLNYQISSNLYIKVKNLLLEKKYKEAEIELLKIDHKYKFDIKFIELFSILYLKTGQINKLIKILESFPLNNSSSIEFIYDIASSLLIIGKSLEASMLLKKIINNSPNFFAAQHDIGLAYSNLRQFEKAEIHFKIAHMLQPNSKEVNYNLGKIYDLQNDFIKANKYYSNAIKIDSNFLDALYNRAGLAYDIKNFEQAKNDYINIYNLNKTYLFTIGNLVNLYRMTGNFDEEKHIINLIFDQLEISNSCIDPLNFLSISDSAELQLKCASIYTRDQYLTEEYVFPKYLHSKIRVAYYSSDFREHPVSHLIAELLELHNRDEFEVYAFALHSPNPNDPLRKRIELGVDHFFDVANISDQEIVDLSRKLEIDIAIDLGGHTKHARTQIFASRVAPIQANYLGFPGTMGASFMDYIIADQYVIPEKNQRFFSEKVAYLPGCFQVNDSKRRKSSREFTRKELGLPENAFVFCCFNQAYKITPEIFKCWMEILQAVEGSVLWLIDHNHVFKSNILRQAKVYFGDKEKVFFSPMIDSAENMKRYSCANIFLDTFPFNAGTTAAEVLGMGLPIITISGESLASRYCGSLLHQMNLKELIMKDCREYVTFSIQLASNLTKLNELAFNIKNKFGKDSLDSRIFSKNIENCYKKWMNH